MSLAFYRHNIPNFDQQFTSQRITVLNVSGALADQIGSLALSGYAEQRRQPVRVLGKSQYHAGRIFWPKRYRLEVQP